MAARRARLSVKPNIAAKLGRGPSRVTPSSTSSSPVTEETSDSSQVPSNSQVSPGKDVTAAAGTEPQVAPGIDVQPHQDKRARPPAAGTEPQAAPGIDIQLQKDKRAKIGETHDHYDSAATKGRKLAVNAIKSQHKQDLITQQQGLAGGGSSETFVGASNNSDELVPQERIHDNKAGIAWASQDSDHVKNSAMKDSSAELHHQSKAAVLVHQSKSSELVHQSKSPELVHQSKSSELVLQSKSNADINPKIRRPVKRFAPITARPRLRTSTKPNIISGRQQEDSKTNYVSSEEIPSEKYNLQVSPMENQTVCGTGIHQETDPHIDRTLADQNQTAYVKVESSQTDSGVTWDGVMTEPQSTDAGDDKMSTEPKSPTGVPLRKRSRFPKTKPNLLPRSSSGRLSISESEDERKTWSASEDKVHANALMSPKHTATVCYEEAHSPDPVSSEASMKMQSPERTSRNKHSSKTSDDDNLVVESYRPKKHRKMEVLSAPVDRSKLTIGDLIHMNPASNPMSLTGDQGDNGPNELVLGNPKSDTPEKEGGKIEPPNVEAEVSAVTVEEPVQVPQVTIGPDGQIVINENTLVVEAPPEERPNNTEVLHETAASNNVGYGKRAPVKLWSQSETKKFYLALSAIGTDFALMCKLFPKRNRTELKRKFKKEEKINQTLIDEAIREKHCFDEDFFEELSRIDEEENITKKPKRRTRYRTPRRKDDKDRAKRSALLYQDSDEEEDVDTGSTVRERAASVAEESDSGSNHEESECEISRMHSQKTRSGRQPRRATPFTADAPTKKVRKKKTRALPKVKAASETGLPGSSGCSPGQFSPRSLSKDNDQVPAGSLVVVTRNPPGGNNGEEGTGMIHVYLVAPDKSRTEMDYSSAETPACEPGQLTAGSAANSSTDLVIGTSNHLTPAHDMTSSDEEGPTLIIDPNTGVVSVEIKSKCQPKSEERTNESLTVSPDVVPPAVGFDTIGGPSEKRIHNSDTLEESNGRDPAETSCPSVSSHGAMTRERCEDSLSLPVPCAQDMVTEMTHGSPTRKTSFSTPPKVTLTDNVIKAILAEDSS